MVMALHIFNRQQKTGWLGDLVIFIWAYPTHYYLESSESTIDMETHPKEAIEVDGPHFFIKHIATVVQWSNPIW